MTNWQLVLTSVAVSFVLAVVAGEVYIRLQYPYVTADVLRQDSLEYEPTRLARHVIPQMRKILTGDGVRISINSLGYRGAEFNPLKPDGVIRIVVLGGSSTFDLVSADDDAWPHLLERELHERGYQAIEVINAGIPEHASWDSLGRLLGEIWMFEPDYILVYHCWNDIRDWNHLSMQRSLLRNLKPIPVVTVNGQERIANPYIYYANGADRLLGYSQLYTRVRNRLITWQQVGLEGLLTGERPTSDPSDYEGEEWSEWGPRQLALNLRLIADAARNIEAQPVFLTQARLPTAQSGAADKERIRYNWVGLPHDSVVRAFEACDEAISAAGLAEDVPVLDLAEPLSGRSEFLLDEVHTTKAGSRALASLTAEFMAEILATNDEGRP